MIKDNFKSLNPIFFFFYFEHFLYKKIFWGLGFKNFLLFFLKHKFYKKMLKINKEILAFRLLKLSLIIFSNLKRLQF